ncbi:hypothetical protein GAYE_SCF01G1930 [Galdieria yellowstonensis]|uniref:Magnesium transporter n=1 Tax=Galdieria yellowstonensis TaxID=3028027 RepID=A0AAV9I9V7_9RHOD|nr:hypothetical protein GAYE_SCF01G1930 [Galdieria yellowstonensis]
MTPKELYPRVRYSVYQISLDFKLSTFQATEREIRSIYESSLETQGKSDNSLSILLEKHLQHFLITQTSAEIHIYESDSAIVSCGKWKAIVLPQCLLLISCPLTLDDIILQLMNDRNFYLFEYPGVKLKPLVLFFRILTAEYKRQRNYVSCFMSNLQSCQNIHVVSNEITQLHSFALSSKEELHALCSHVSALVLEICSYDWQNAQGALRELLMVHKELSQIRKSLIHYEQVLFCWMERSRTEMQNMRTNVVVYNFFMNIILCSVLIASTTGNSFGTNLNIPLYYSTKGYKAALWYIVSFSVIIVACILIALFVTCNKSVTEYIKKQRNHSFRLSSE